VRSGAHLKSKGAQGQASTPLFPSQGVPARGRVASPMVDNALRRWCGAAPQDSRQEPHWSRRVEGSGAGWACLQPPTPHPHSAHRPRSFAKGRGLSFRGPPRPESYPSAGEGMSFLTQFVAGATAPRLIPSFGGCVARVQGMYDNTNHSVQSHVRRAGPEFVHRRSKHLETLVCKAATCAG
jgi:hypothetical protein